MKRTAIPLLAVVGLAVSLTACDPEAKDVGKNLSTDADNFKISRRVTFVNGITDKVILEVDGKCSVDADNPVKASVLCKTDSGTYVKHLITLSDNVFMSVEQTEASDTSASHYRFVLRPGSLIPDVDVNKAQ